ncbi:hypothetical protein ACORG1_13220 [Mycobacterium sp. TJFP1]
MSPQKPETDPRALAHRAAEELAAGGYQAAQTTALVAIAGALTGEPEPIGELIGERTVCWLAYYSDFSGMAVFPTEIEAHRHANGTTMEVVELRAGDVRDQIRARWQR